MPSTSEARTNRISTSEMTANDNIFGGAYLSKLSISKSVFTKTGSEEIDIIEVIIHTGEFLSNPLIACEVEQTLRNFMLSRQHTTCIRFEMQELSNQVKRGKAVITPSLNIERNEIHGLTIAANAHKEFISQWVGHEFVKRHVLINQSAVENPGDDISPRLEHLLGPEKHQRRTKPPIFICVFGHMRHGLSMAIEEPHEVINTGVTESESSGREFIEDMRLGACIIASVFAHELIHVLLAKQRWKPLFVNDLLITVNVVEASLLEDLFVGQIWMLMMNSPCQAIVFPHEHDVVR